MTCRNYGTYGFLNAGKIPDEPLLLLEFGLEARRNERYDFDNADRDYDGFLFQYTLSGRGCFEKDGQRFSLTPEYAFFSYIPEHSRYYLPMEGGQGDWEFLYVHFGGPAALPFYRTILSSFGSCFSLPSDSFPIQLWLNLHKDMNAGRQLRRYEGGELIYRFLTSLLRTLENPSPSDFSPQIQESIQYMKEHFSERLSMEELAAMQGFSPAYFTRLFSSSTGQSPLAYLTQLRLNQATFLLLNSSLTVEEVATGCGFSCGNYFCKVFRRAAGLSPAEYRRRYSG